MQYQPLQIVVNVHSCLIIAMLIGINGWRAARDKLSRVRQIRRDIRVSGVVTRQNAALVFMTGQGLPGPTTSP